MIQKTLCMDSVQFGGLHYDVHSMYGWWEAVATKPAIRQITGERSFVTSRSTFIGDFLSVSFHASWFCKSVHDTDYRACHNE